MKWQDAVKCSKRGTARRDDESYPCWWLVLANGKGELYDDCYLVEHIELGTFDRDRWEDWEPEDPKDVIELLSEVTDE